MNSLAVPMSLNNTEPNVSNGRKYIRPYLFYTAGSNRADKKEQIQLITAVILFYCFILCVLSNMSVLHELRIQ